MKNRLRVGVVSLGLTAFALFLMVSVSCNSTKSANGPEPVGKDVQMTELRQVIQSQILDPNRATALLEMAGQAEGELGAINNGYAKRSNEFGKMSTDHKKTANDLSVYLRGWDTEVHNQRHELVTVMLAMKGQTTREEWPQVSAAFMSSVMSESDRFQSIRRLANQASAY